MKNPVADPVADAQVQELKQQFVAAYLAKLSLVIAPVDKHPEFKSFLIDKAVVKDNFKKHYKKENPLDYFTWGCKQEY